MKKVSWLSYTVLHTSFHNGSRADSHFSERDLLHVTPAGQSHADNLTRAGAHPVEDGVLARAVVHDDDAHLAVQGVRAIQGQLLQQGLQGARQVVGALPPRDRGYPDRQPHPGARLGLVMRMMRHQSSVTPTAEGLAFRSLQAFENAVNRERSSLTQQMQTAWLLIGIARILHYVGNHLQPWGAARHADERYPC